MRPIWAYLAQAPERQQQVNRAPAEEISDADIMKSIDLQYPDMSLPHKKAMAEVMKKNKDYERTIVRQNSSTAEKDVNREYSPNILSAEDMAAATARGSRLSGMERQVAGVDSLEQELSALKAIPREFDMSGAAALTKAFMGGDPTEFLRKPPTPLERKQLEIKLQELIQRRKENETLSQLKSIFGQKTNPQVINVAERAQTTGNEQKTETGKETTVNINVGKESTNVAPKGDSGKEEKGLIKAQQYQMTEAAANVYRELGEYADILEKTGYVVAGKDARNLEEKKSRVLGAVGKAENMGVLHKYDMERIDNFLGNATGIMGPLRGLVKGGAKADVAAVRDYRKTLRDRAKGYTESLRGEFPTRINDINALEGRFDAADAGRGGSPVGTIKAGRGGISYKKIKPGPDGDKSAWEPVK